MSNAQRNDSHEAARPGWKWALAPLLASALLSCMTGPDYQRPSTNTPARFKESTSETARPVLEGTWWHMFQDPQLDALIDEACQANQDLKAAAARVAQARASALSVKSGFYPVVTMDASATRSRTPGVDAPSKTLSDKLSETSAAVNKASTIVKQVEALAQGNATPTSAGFTSQSSSGGTSATTSSRYQIPFDLSYEIDIWGRVKRSYEAVQAQTQAQVYDAEVVRQTLISDLARNYFNLRALDSQQEILAKNMALYEEQVTLTRQQNQVGLANETNALQAEVQLESTRARTADTRRQRTDLEHAIAILLGRAPTDFSLAACPLQPTPPPTVPPGLPSDLLRQRPDVAEAEQSLVSASAQIGVAQANLMPSVRLTGSASLQSGDLGDLLNWGNRTWSIGPSISVPIFNGGQLKADVEKAKARYEELEAVYRKSVLTALRDVEDSLADLRERAVQAEAQTKAVAAAREYLRLTDIQYRAGTIDYLQVINAEQTLLSNELSELDTLNQRISSTILLVKALGGGWNPDVPRPTQEVAK